jgi:hypothetical protein
MAAGPHEADIAAMDRGVQRMIWALFIFDAVLIAAFLALFLSGFRVEVLAIGLERSIPNWYSATKLLILAQLLAFIVWRVSADTWWETLILVAPALLFALMSLEEVAAVRDRFGRILITGDEKGVRHDVVLVGTLLPGLGLVLALVAIGNAYARIVRPAVPAMAKAGAGVTVFMLGAVGVDVLFGEPGVQGIRILPAAAEEGAELIGVTLLIWAACDLAMPYLVAMLRGSAIRSVCR